VVQGCYFPAQAKLHPDLYLLLDSITVLITTLSHTTTKLQSLLKGNWRIYVLLSQSSTISAQNWRRGLQIARLFLLAHLSLQWNLFYVFLEFIGTYIRQKEGHLVLEHRNSHFVKHPLFLTPHSRLLHVVPSAAVELNVVGLLGTG
jgi:hypothetical protein